MKVLLTFFLEDAIFPENSRFLFTLHCGSRENIFVCATEQYLITLVLTSTLVNEIKRLLVKLYM